MKHLLIGARDNVRARELTTSERRLARRQRALNGLARGRCALLDRLVHRPPVYEPCLSALRLRWRQPSLLLRAAEWALVTSNMVLRRGSGILEAQHAFVMKELLAT